MKKYKYRKVNPNVLFQIRQLRIEGFSYQKIANKLNLSESTVIYWLKPEEREKTIERVKLSRAKLSKKEKKLKEKKQYKYKKKYYQERYNDDDEYRKRHIQNITNSFNKRREEWLIAGLCSRCGKEKINKKWKMCEECREKKRNKTKQKRQNEVFTSKNVHSKTI